MTQKLATFDADRLMDDLAALDDPKHHGRDVGELWNQIATDFNPTLPPRDPCHEAGDGVERTLENNIRVYSKKLVMQVFMDADNNYSVKGYNARAHECFGKIYLGLDKGHKYYAQSSKANLAIQGISERDAFNITLEMTHASLAACGIKVFALADLFDLLNKVLGTLCEYWFDLPDESAMVIGGLRGDAKPPARCPGDFSLVSYDIFTPVPDEQRARIGQAQGHLIKEAALGFVKAQRASGETPAGKLSSALFEAFPHENDLLARTLLGVMMGFLPTVYFNLVFALDAWSKSGELAKLQEKLRANPELEAYLRARSVLKEPFKHAVQRTPMPGAVWRTAIKEHFLGERNPIRVCAGDKVFIDIASVTRKDLDAGITDVFAVFGGNRNLHPHPTHACPAYAMAMGVMLGFISGLMAP